MSSQNERDSKQDGRFFSSLRVKTNADTCITYSPATFPNYLGGISSNNHIFWDASEKYSSRAYYTVCSYYYSWSYECVSAYPSAFPNRDRTFHEQHVRSSIIMSPSAKMCVLRDGCLLTNSDQTEAVKNGAITYRDLISDANIPRDLDSHTREYMYLTANLRAK